VAANNYFTFIDWKQAVDIAKCCIAKKQASQVNREANLMGRDSDVDSEIQFLQASIILLNNYTYSGDFNQITDAECLELIQRINTMCNCEDEAPYSVDNACASSAVCISGFYEDQPSPPVNFTPQTVYPDLACNYVFSVTALEEINVFIQKTPTEWELVYNGEAVDSNTTLNGTYGFTEGDINYRFVVALGACT